ncbi:HAD-IIIC family phosphatase [Bradyrhizobium sp. WYCCWR 13023]|uniref:HAD-IIIC family phosphatase n=1 Tax=Bradyrhizobium zhengyangense TaxID=2911009 RepID=A0A9X1RM33_9BRAD|nr:HAD-IIIC family phosphatase [Bradyrhizobium zhengyangense]MCG2632725.1 HAD-IIIC family phosphatase [Bradyrhizobium zhengyangense]
MPDGRVETRGSVAIAATFTADPLQPALEFLLTQAGLGLEVEFAPYNQVLQELISTSSKLALNKGVNVVLVRLEDLVRDIVDEAATAALLQDAHQEILSALNGFVRRSKTPTIVAVLETSPQAPKQLSETLSSAGRKLLEQAAMLPGISVLSPRDIDLVASGERYDADSNDLAHIPFSETHFAAIALALTRKIHALLVPDRKVLVLDCDNTLWRGVVGEDGVEGITVPACLAALQRFAVEAQGKGVLICLASKNTERDVVEVFERRNDMILKLDHVVEHRINWQSKPENILALSKSLNLGLDAFVFIDDNPVECELMRAELPQVLTLLLPPDEEIESFLARLWAFDKVAVTEEDKRRTGMYKEEAARRELEKGTVDIVDFVASLQVEVDIGSPDEAEWARLAQLTQRTNQFNFTTIRRNEAELRALEREAPGSVQRVRVRDRFGDYGLVGLAINQHRAGELVVDTFLLSCRVLGRGVEHAILRAMGELARKKNIPIVSLPFKRSARNEPAWAFAESVAGTYRKDDDQFQFYRIPTEVALAILHRPGQDPDAVIKARNSESKKAVAVANPQDLAGRYTALSRELITGEHVLRAMRKASSRVRDLPNPAVDPVNPSERRMLALWEEVLGVDGLGVEDDYVAVGGTSLLAARLFASIVQEFGVKLPLTAILEHSTVRKLTALLQSAAVPTNALVELRPRGHQNVFFVHDGDGETLLYMNVARRLPEQFAVFGIEPQRLPNIPLAHASLEDMAAHCISVMRQRQPQGPYIVGGMCAGGVLAHEIAHQLEAQHQKVELVIILDAARPGAAKRQGRIARQRFDRFKQLFAGGEHSRNTTEVLGAAARKLVNVTLWEVVSRGKRWSVKTRFNILQKVLAGKRGWPRGLPALTVRQIYDSAEVEYKATQSSFPVLLVRARNGHAGDTAFREIYTDETLGWRDVAKDLSIEDVNGGHFSMLQEPYAELLANTIASRLVAKNIATKNSSVKQIRVDAA